MTGLAALFAPLALLLPTAAGIVPANGEVRLTPREVAANEAPVEPGWQQVEPPNTVPIVGQVRIEQRVTVRVVPRSPVLRQSLMAEIPDPSAPSSVVERKMGKCVPVAGIAGVQTGQDSQLILFMRDQRIVSARLEKACQARDFYSGFYIERSADGMLCVDRDKLRSRTGVQCQVSRMRRLVAGDDD